MIGVNTGAFSVFFSVKYCYLYWICYSKIWLYFWYLVSLLLIM